MLAFSCCSKAARSSTSHASFSFLVQWKARPVPPGVRRLTMTCLLQAAQNVVMVRDPRFGKDAGGFLERWKPYAHKKRHPKVPFWSG
jgi:hypothetical protein